MLREGLNTVKNMMTDWADTAHGCTVRQPLVDRDTQFRRASINALPREDANRARARRAEHRPLDSELDGVARPGRTKGLRS